MNKLTPTLAFILLFSCLTIHSQVYVVSSQVNITTNTTWSPSNPAPIGISNVVITCNNTLTIESQTIEFIKSTIVVQPGATLILRNTTLRGGNLIIPKLFITIPINWFGIKLWGRLITYRSNIENADVGVWVRDETKYVPENTGSPIEGFPTETPCVGSFSSSQKIYADQTSFNDNGVCVFFDNYYNKPCNFNYCNFQSRNPLRIGINKWMENQLPQKINNDYWPRSLVYGFDGGKEHFVGCLFKGPSLPVYSTNPRIIGMEYENDANDLAEDIMITSNDFATYSPPLGGGGAAWRAGKFENLFIGVSAINILEPPDLDIQLTISKSIFEGVVTGIKTSDIKGLKLLCNTFNAIQYDYQSMVPCNYVTLNEGFFPLSSNHKYISLNLQGVACFTQIKNGWGFNIDGNNIVWPVNYTSSYTYDTQHPEFKTFMNFNSGFGIIINNKGAMNNLGNTISNNTFEAQLLPNEQNKNIIGIGVIGGYQNCEISCNEFDNLSFDWFLFSTSAIDNSSPIPKGTVTGQNPRNLSKQGVTAYGNNNKFSLLNGSNLYNYEQNIFCNFEGDFEYHCVPNIPRSRTEPIIRSEWLAHDPLTGDIYYWEYYFAGFSPKGNNYTFYDWKYTQRYQTMVWSYYDPITGIYTDQFSSNIEKDAFDEKNCTFNCVQETIINPSDPANIGVQ